MVSLSKHLSLVSLTGFALLCLCAPGWAADGSVRNIRYDQMNHHFLIDTSGPVKASVNTLSIAGHKRIIIDVDNAEIGTELPRDVQLLQNLAQQMPAVRNLTVNQYGGNGRPIVRILIDLQGDPGNVRIVRNQGPHIELELNESAAYTPSSSRSLDMPPSLAGLKQSEPIYPSAQNASGGVSRANDRSSDTVPRDNYNRSLQAQQEQHRQIEALQTEISRLKAQMNTESNNTAFVEDMKRTLAILNQKYNSLSQENQYLKARLSTDDQNQNTSRAEQDRLREENSRLKASNATLQDKVTSLNAEKNKPDLTLTSKQVEIDRLRADNLNLKTRLEKALATPPSSVQDEVKRNLDDLKRRYDNLAVENRSLKAQMAAKSQTATEKTADWATQQSEISRLKTENANLQARLNLQSSKASASSSLSETDLQNLRKQLTLAQQSLNDSIRTINEQNKEIAYLRNQVSDVKSGLEASSREQLSQLQASLDEKDATIKDLQRQLSSKSASTGATSGNQAEVASLRRQLEKVTQQYQSDVESLNRQLCDSQTELASSRQKSSQITELQSQIVHLQSQLASANTKATSVQTGRASAAEIQKKDSQIGQLQAELSKLKASQASGQNLNGKIAALQTELASLQSVQSERDAAVNELTEVKAELDSLKAGSGKASASSKEALDKLTRENRDLQKMLDSMQQAAASSSGKSNQTRQLESQLASLKSDLSDLQAKYEKAKQQANKAEQDLLFLQKSGKQTANTTEKPSAQSDKQLTELNRQLAEIRKENETLKDKLAQANRGTPSSAATNSEAEQDYLAGKSAMDSKDINKAIDKFKEAQLLEPNNSKYAIDYSIALAEDHQYAEAIDVLRRYLQRNPIDREAYNQLGKLYLLNDQADAANQAFSRAMSTSTLNNYATSLKKLGRTSDAESVFKLALTLNPKDSEVLFNLGNLYNAENKLEQARNKYLEAIQIRPDFAEAHYNLGLIFSKMGDNVKAVSHLEKFLQLSPNARNAETIRAYVQKLKA